MWRAWLLHGRRDDGSGVSREESAVNGPATWVVRAFLVQLVSASRATVMKRRQIVFVNARRKIYSYPAAFCDNLRMPNDSGETCLDTQNDWDVGTCGTASSPWGKQAFLKRGVVWLLQLTKEMLPEVFSGIVLSR